MATRSYSTRPCLVSLKICPPDGVAEEQSALTQIVGEATATAIVVTNTEAVEVTPIVVPVVLAVGIGTLDNGMGAVKRAPLREARLISEPVTQTLDMFGIVKLEEEQASTTEVTVGKLLVSASAAAFVVPAVGSPVSYLDLVDPDAPDAPDAPAVADIADTVDDIADVVRPRKDKAADSSL